MMRAGMAVMLALGIGCGRHASPPLLIDAAPAGTTALAGLDLIALRASPMYAKLPRVVTAFAEPLREAPEVMLVWNGTDLLLLTRGTPPGYTSIGGGIAAAGAPERIEAARAQLASGRSGAPGLVARAGGAAIWAVAQGDGKLPLTGNLANANNLLRDAGYTALSVKLGEGLDVALKAECRSAEEARRFEESLRAVIALLGVAYERQSGVAAMLRTIRVVREDRIVRANVAADPDAIAKIF
jgi:hypothetical protein